MTQPKPVATLSAGREASEAEEEAQRVYTSSVSAVEERGREIYVYLEASDSLEFQDQRPPTDPTYMRVQVDMNGHRHWTVRLNANDTLETGRILPPPPPPPPPGGGGGGG